ILRLAFGVPVLLFHGQATVGGRAYGGSGDKRADFLMQAAKTGNLSIVEIKTPQTELLAKREYRGGIFPPHPDLTGAVAQVLDQRWQLQQNNRALADDRRRQAADPADDRPSPEVYAVQCVIVAGRSPREVNLQKSFELYRNSLAGVLVLTYDELVLKLVTLLEILRDPEATELKVPTVTVKKPRTRKLRGPARCR
ncbi:MAG TPA: Shedu immune nuclease family protein, partial [Edaphobacter sp.]|nr:Shedu immune nuclease family protein [Edaphobacter sp.]